MFTSTQNKLSINSITSSIPPKDLYSPVSGIQFCIKLDFNLKYNGTASSTSNGLTCQRWDSQNPHKHHYNNPELFPEETIENAANYCRTPNGNVWPWCFTASPEVRSQACDIDIKLRGGGITSGTYLWLHSYDTKYLKRCYFMFQQ